MENNKEIFDKRYLQRKFDTQEYGIVELLILKSLYKYLFLDEKTITDAVNLKLKPRLQKPSYKRNLKNMLGKAIRKYSFREIKSNGYEKIEHVVYYLTRPAYEFIRENYRHMQRTYRMKENAPKRDLKENYDKNYIMERLALNRWHLYMLATYKKSIIEETYCGKRTFLSGRIKLPSCIRMKSDIGKVSIIGMVYPRTEKEVAIECLVKKIEEICEMSVRLLNKNTMIIIVCSSIYEIEDAHKKISEKNEKIVQGLLYTVDADIVTGNAMDRMYAVHEKNGVYKKIFYRYAISGS